MRVVHALGIFVVLVGVIAVGLAVAPADLAEGQTVRVRPSREVEVFGLDAFGGIVRLGVAVRDVDQADVTREKLAGPAGAVIDNVESDGPAAKAGLRTGDVVVEFDGENVRSARHLTRLIRESVAGRDVRIAVMRDGRRTELTVTPAEGVGPDFRFDADRIRDSMKELRGNLDRDLRGYSFDVERLDPAWRLTGRGRLGVTVQDMTPQLAEYFGVKDGVLVSSVTADGPAAKGGIKAGDIITAINGRAVTRSSDITRELRSVEDGKEASIAITRDRKEMALKVIPEARLPRRLPVVLRGV
jgi:serine protease Do